MGNDSTERNSIDLYINGERHRVRGEAIFSNVSDYLRRELGAVGTKVVCAEGDCGACSVLVGRPEPDQFNYVPINACIHQMHQLDQTHLITVEGLSGAEGLNAVQEAMVRCHGAQCGFCTPGFVVAMTALCETEQPLTDEAIRLALTGNLCRCTGYEPILKAAREVSSGSWPKLNIVYPPEPMLADLTGLSPAVRVECGGRIYFQPDRLAEALRYKADHPDAVVIQGGTDLGVLCNKRGLVPPALLSVSRLPGFTNLREEGQQVVIGGAVRWHVLENYFRPRVPAFHQIIKWFGAPAIRYAGTLAGNIINGSPIADSLPFLFVMEAEVEFSSLQGVRRVPINRLYRGYKQLDRREDEILSAVYLPLPQEDDILWLEKVSKRRDLDISTLAAGIRLQLAGSRIKTARIALGGVAETVIRLPETEAFLREKEMSYETFLRAGEIARTEIKPLDDVRGSAEYRRQLAQNIFAKFYQENAHREVVA